MLDREEKISLAAKKHWSAAYVGYWIDAPYCAACGAPASPPHHLHTRGTGGPDDSWNLLSLCAKHHTEIGTMGNALFMRKYPETRKKIMRALNKPRTEW